MDRITRNVFWYIVVIACSFYALLHFSMQPRILSQVMNGIFYGMAFTVAYVFRRLILKTVFSREEFDDVRMFAMSILFGGLALLIFRGTSIISNVADAPAWPPVTPFNTFGTYCAILAGAGMILAPGLDKGYLHGEDKRTVWAGVMFGMFLSVAMIIIQVG